MGIFWEDCFLCNGRCKLTIGDNFNKFHVSQDVDCPMCQGRGQCPIRWSKEKSFKNRLRGAE